MVEKIERELMAKNDGLEIHKGAGCATLIALGLPVVILSKYIVQNMFS